MSNFKVFNGFGIKPSKSYTAAGWDFYVPNVIDEEKKKVASVCKACKESTGDVSARR